MSSNSSNETYPAILEKKTKAEQLALAEKYQNANPGLCAFVDPYGLNSNKICTDRDILRVEITNADTSHLKKMAKEFLIKNKEFSNIQDPSQLKLRKIDQIKGCLSCEGSVIKTIGLKLSFENQVYHGLEVKNTGVDIFLDAKKVFQMHNHWYKNIVIPSVDRLSYQDARETLIGKKFTYSDWTGEKKLIINKDSFNDYENKVIYPYETDRGLELRVCLVVGAGVWHFYIDSTTGELIDKEQIIYF